jgi:hypothetical protein
VGRAGHLDGSEVSREDNIAMADAKPSQPIFMLSGSRLIELVRMERLL